MTDSEPTIETIAQCVAQARQTGRLQDALAARKISLTEWALAGARLDEEFAAEDARLRFVEAYEAALTRQVPTFLQHALPQAGSETAPTTPATPREETAAMPTPDEVKRLILLADPRNAIPLGPRPTTKSECCATPDETSETVMMPATDEIRQIVAAARNGPIRELTVDEYAVIRAMVAVRPESAAQLWERHGVPEDRRRATEKTMQLRFDRDRAAAQRFAERLQHFVHHLSSAQLALSGKQEST